jgi:hypothetical protein
VGDAHRSQHLDAADRLRAGEEFRRDVEELSGVGDRRFDELGTRRMGGRQRDASDYDVSVATGGSL